MNWSMRVATKNVRGWLKTRAEERMGELSSAAPGFVGAPMIKGANGVASMPKAFRTWRYRL